MSRSSCASWFAGRAPKARLSRGSDSAGGHLPARKLQAREMTPAKIACRERWLVETFLKDAQDAHSTIPWNCEAEGVCAIGRPAVLATDLRRKGVARGAHKRDPEDSRLQFPGWASGRLPRRHSMSWPAKENGVRKAPRKSGSLLLLEACRPAPALRECKGRREAVAIRGNTYLSPECFANQRRTTTVIATISAATRAMDHALTPSPSSSDAAIWRPKKAHASTVGSMPRNEPSA